MSKTLLSIGVLTGAVALIAIGWLILRRRNGNSPELPDGITLEECDILELERVIGWGRDRRNLIRDNANFRCVVIKISPEALREAVAQQTLPEDAARDTNNRCGTVLAIFNSIDKTIIHDHCCLIISRGLSHDLEALFGAKPMIVIE
jgi:hypothetical protein